jgi:carotenoid cleavage dioxygenase-like enzyme
VWTQQWAVQALSPEEVAAYAATKRAELHVARREARTVAETGGFTFSGHPVDSDRDSILRINNAATTAITASLTASPFATVWKCGDDYEMSLDAAGVMALQAALSAHGQACHDRSNALCALIDDPQADLHAVAAEMGCGWPTR